MLKEKTFRTSARIAHKLGVAEAARRILRNTPSPISKAIRKHEIVHRIKLVDDQAIDEAMRKVVGLVQEQSIDVENYFEFGVYNGSTLIAMTRALEAADLNHVRVFGFDTFAGLPEFASSDCHGHWKPGDFNSSIEYFKINVLRFKPYQWYDLIWSAGLFDYFKDKHFVYMINKYYRYLTDGGAFIIGNFSNSNPTKRLMEVLSDWYLVHRSKYDLVRMALEAKAREELVEVDMEELGVNLFLRIRAA